MLAFPLPAGRVLSKAKSLTGYSYKKLFFRTNGINCVFPLPAGGIPATFGQRRLRRVPFCFYLCPWQARSYDKKALFLLIKGISSQMLAFPLPPGGVLTKAKSLTEYSYKKTTHK